jgi:hypothetical protein
MNKSNWIPSNAMPKQLIPTTNEIHIFNLKAAMNFAMSIADAEKFLRSHAWVTASHTTADILVWVTRVISTIHCNPQNF